MRNQAQYWDTILDPRNLSDKRDLLTQFELETERAFYQTPAQQYAYQLMGEVQGKKILELGGGLGVNAVILACAGAKVTVIDISEKRVEWMQRLVAQTQLQSQVQVIRMSAEELAFPANRFDIVYSNAVLIHVDKQKTAREVRRVLTPGGKAIFVEPLKYHPLVNLYRFTVAPKIWREIAQYFSFQDIETLGKLFREYTHREFYLVSFFAFYWEFGKRNLPRFQKSLARWQKVDSQILRIFPFLNKLCWFTVFCGTK
ncbi:MAG: class I SAM-dependent methyltransferase [bacterium]|nr:class I SAM-dependent methyltransferase [bacterium]